jgi:hypothetical protein
MSQIHPAQLLQLGVKVEIQKHLAHIKVRHVCAALYCP